jgi:hypothetical protein
MLDNLQADDGHLLRTWKAGAAKIDAYLEDYANLIDALLELYQTTFDERWFVEARRLADYALEHFKADEGGFYDTADNAEALIVRPRNLQDNATPSGSAMLAKGLIRLAAYTGEGAYDESARGTLRLLTEAMRQFPHGFGEALSATDMLVNGMAEVAVVGQPDDAKTQSLLDVTRATYRPNLIVALAAENVEAEATIPLLSYRALRGGEPTVYVCRNFACKMPVTSVAAVEELLEQA